MVKKRKYNFQKGNTYGKKGRAKGAVGKFTTLRQAFIDAFKEVGGTDGLAEWVREGRFNKKHFYQMIAKMLPREVKIDGKMVTPDDHKALTEDELRTIVRSAMEQVKKKDHKQ